jgi:PAS domain S-box-containing protein
MKLNLIFSFQYQPDPGNIKTGREQHSRETSNFYKQVFDSLEDYAVFTIDREGNISSWNTGAENLLGYSEEEILGVNCAIFFTEKDLANHSNVKERTTALINGRAVDERFHVRKDKTEFWASGLMFPLFDEYKQHVGFTKIMRDLTERKKAEEALVNAKEFFKNIVDTVREPLIVLNKDLTINTANHAFYEVFKVSREKVKGIRIYDIDSGKWDTEKLKEMLEKDIPANNSFEALEIEYHSPPTGKRIMLINGRTLYSISNRREMILLAVEDITERKAMEQQRNDFIGIVSHELKTPVTSLKAFGQVLQLHLQQAGDTKLVNMLSRMDAQVNKLTHLINDLLDATKIEGGKLQFQEEVFSFPDVLEEIVEEVQRTTDRHKIIIENNPPCELRGDRERLGQVLTNFLSNAIKYSPDANKIIVRAEVERETLTCSVQDFGIGIPEDKLSKVFERFYRLTEDKLHTFPGVGLGLFISSEIIKRQGGKIWVQSKAGEGSTFYFSLPIHK